MLLEWSRIPGPDGRVPQFILLTPHDVAAAVAAHKAEAAAASSRGIPVSVVEPKVVLLQAATRGGAGAGGGA